MRDAWGTRNTSAARHEVVPASFFLLLCAALVFMTVMQFRKVRMIMSKRQVTMQVSMGFLNQSFSIMVVVVMLFVQMDMVVF